jgi:PIN domain nuclease of toxin-antitoxin system
MNLVDSSAWMALGQVVELTQEMALLAAVLSIWHKLPVADRLVLTAARTHAAVLRTQDEQFRGLVGVKLLPP